MNREIRYRIDLKERLVYVAYSGQERLRDIGIDGHIPFDNLKNASEKYLQDIYDPHPDRIAAYLIARDELLERGLI